MNEQVYVTVGHPNSRIPIMPLVAVRADDEKDLREQAKKLRKEVAENAQYYGFRTPSGGTLTFKPSELYWAVFESNTDEKPIMQSDNYYWGVLGKELRQEEPRVGNSWYDTGYADAKAGGHNAGYNPPKSDKYLAVYEKGFNDYQESSYQLSLILESASE